MSNVAGGVPLKAVMPFIVLIALGLGTIMVDSIGLANAKKKKGAGYYIQILGLTAAIVFTLYFGIKFVQGKAITQQAQALGMASGAAKLGISTNNGGATLTARP